MAGDRKRWQDLAGKAVAELAIVVVGVTLALWADNWATQRNHRDVETARLVALSDNVTETLDDIRLNQEEVTSVAAVLRRLIDGVETSPDSQRDLIRTGLLYGPLFSPELNVYDDLKNSGELALLTNAELRRALAQMDSSIERIRFALDDMATVQQLQFDAYAVDHPYLGVFFDDDTGKIARDVDDGAVLEIFADVGFRNRMRLKRDLVSQLQFHFDHAENVLEEVQSLIDFELSPR